MSFVSQRTTPASANALATDINTALTGMGWTEYDVVTATTDIVYSSAGMAGWLNKTLLVSPLTVNNYIYGVVQHDSGTATAGGASTLTCAGKSWSVDGYAGKQVVIADGTGGGQTRRIASNTATELTVALAWDTQPNATSVFYIVDETYRVIMSGWAAMALREAY